MGGLNADIKVPGERLPNKLKLIRASADVPAAATDVVPAASTIDGSGWGGTINSLRRIHPRKKRNGRICGDGVGRFMLFGGAEKTGRTLLLHS